MRYAIEYVCNEKTMSVSDIDIDDISNDIEKKFLYWTDRLEEIITIMLLNLQYYDKYEECIFLYDDVKEKFNNFIFLSMFNIIQCTIINFGKLFSESNEYSIMKYINFCRQNENIFSLKLSNEEWKVIRKSLTEVKEFYDNYFKEIRNEHYAHLGIIDINEKLSILEDVSSIGVKRKIREVSNLINKIWNNYSKKDLSFKLENENNVEYIFQLLINKFDNN